jgi:hypothetical protein
VIPPLMPPGWVRGSLSSADIPTILQMLKEGQFLRLLLGHIAACQLGLPSPLALVHSPEEAMTQTTLLIWLPVATGERH